MAKGRALLVACPPGPLPRTNISSRSSSRSSGKARDLWASTSDRTVIRFLGCSDAGSPECPDSASSTLLSSCSSSHSSSNSSGSSSGGSAETPSSLNRVLKTERRDSKGHEGLSTPVNLPSYANDGLDTDSGAGEQAACFRAFEPLHSTGFGFFTEALSPSSVSFVIRNSTHTFRI